MTRGSRIRALAAGALVLLTAACGGIAVPTEAAPDLITKPLPSGATVLPPQPPSMNVDDNSCNPTASVRPANPPTVTPGGAIDRIRQRGRLVVGLDIGSNLFSFRDPVTGVVSGFDVDIAHEVARDILGDPSKLEFRMLSSSERISGLQNRSVDIVVKTMSITCDRRKVVGFSTVYFTASQRILTTKSSAITEVGDLSGRRVCAASGTTSLNRLQSINPPVQVLSVPNWADCLVSLQQGQVDAVSTDDAILAGLAAQDPYLHIVGSPIHSEPYGIGTTIDDIELTRFINATLERIRADGTWRRMYTRWLSILGPAPVPPAPTYLD